MLAVFLILGSTNAVNLTDGLDGLAAGSAIFAFAAFVVIGFWRFRHPGIYQLTQGARPRRHRGRDGRRVRRVPVVERGAGRIFMGDTGSLAIGAGLAVPRR